MQSFSADTAIGDPALFLLDLLCPWLTRAITILEQPHGVFPNASVASVVSFEIVHQLPSNLESSRGRVADSKALKEITNHPPPSLPTSNTLSTNVTHVLFPTLKNPSY